MPDISRAEQSGGFAATSHTGGSPARWAPRPALPEEGAIERVPEAVRQAARLAFESRDPTVRIADLIYDSLIDGDRRSNGEPQGRTLRFGDSDWGIEVTIVPDKSALRLRFRFGPPQRVSVEVHHSGGTIVAESDRHGVGDVGGVVPGLVTLVFRLAEPPGARPVQTSWVRM